ncbi:MAG TPA: hypothetical protein VF657_05800, partial [Actinoplanes sp.]
MAWNPGTSVRTLALAVAGALALLVLILGLLGDGRSSVRAVGELRDAEVIARTGGETSADVVVLRVSDPVERIECSIAGDDFAGGPPPVGRIVVVDHRGGGCAPPTVRRGAPRAPMIGAGAAGLLGLGAYAWGRNGRSRPVRKARHTRRRVLAGAARTPLQV